MNPSKEALEAAKAIHYTLYRDNLGNELTANRIQLAIDAATTPLEARVKELEACILASATNTVPRVQYEELDDIAKHAVACFVEEEKDNVQLEAEYAAMVSALKEWVSVGEAAIASKAMAVAEFPEIATIIQKSKEAMKKAVDG